MSEIMNPVTALLLVALVVALHCAFYWREWL